MEHSFTITIRNILNKYFIVNAEELFNKSTLIQYINEKTK